MKMVFERAADHSFWKRWRVGRLYSGKWGGRGRSRAQPEPTDTENTPANLVIEPPGEPPVDSPRPETANSTPSSRNKAAAGIVTRTRTITVTLAVEPTPVADEPKSPPKLDIPPQESPKEDSSKNEDPPSDSRLDAHAKEALDVHNRLRANHGAKPLQWDPLLAAEALKASNQCVMNHAFMDAASSKYGSVSQNMHQQIKRPAEAIDGDWGWYAELQNYHGGNIFDGQKGHVNNMLWKNSEKLGCALSDCGIYTCNYAPHSGSAAENLQI